MSIIKQQRNDSCMQFASCIGLHVASKGSNFVFSPFSIRAALSLAAIGANGGTRSEILSFLGSPTIADLNEVTGSILESVRVNSNGFEEDGGGCISFANGVWVDQSMFLKPSFQEIATSVYGAAAKTADFRYAVKEAVEEANLWIENNTNGLIKNLIPPVRGLTRLILANALYFKAAWLYKFGPYQTKNESFHLLNGNLIQVPFMSASTDQFISSFEYFKVLKLPFEQIKAKRQFSMLIFLPEKKDGLSNLIQNAINTPNFINSHVPCKHALVGRFKIPKFKISSDFDASKALQELGLVNPFQDADFTEMVISSQIDAASVESISIAKVIHGATIEVDEYGTEASASTVMIFEKQCMRMGPHIDFVADHPFMFAIIEETTGALLFLGHVIDPSKII